MAAHLHRCKACDFIWKHDIDTLLEDTPNQQRKCQIIVKAHTCPSCNCQDISNYYAVGFDSQEQERLMEDLPLTQPE